jgi:hypothetical protein
MKTKSLLLALVLSMLAMNSQAAKNVCDGLKDAGVSNSDIDRCISEQGKSSFLESKEKEEVNYLQSVEELKKNQENLVTQEFSREMIKSKLYGIDAFASKQTYDEDNKIYGDKEELTHPRTLCIFLGFEKDIKAELFTIKKKHDIQKVAGMHIKNYLASYVPKSLEIENPTKYKDKEEIYRTNFEYYKSITCVKRKDKDLKGSFNYIKKLPTDIANVTRDRDDTVNDSDDRREKRKPEERKSNRLDGGLPWASSAK